VLVTLNAQQPANELKRVSCAGIAAKIDQAFIDDLGARLSGDVAAQVNVEFAGDL
jgi:hypothetical protein